MLFSTIVIAMAAILLILIGVWLFSPALRRWMEEPKYRMLRQEERFDPSGAPRVEKQSRRSEGGSHCE